MEEKNKEQQPSEKQVAPAEKQLIQFKPEEHVSFCDSQICVKGSLYMTLLEKFNPDDWPDKRFR